MPFALPRLEGQGRLRAIKGLNVTLLIDAQDDGMGGGIEIQPENGRGLGFEVGVGAGDVVVQLMGSETMAAPEPADETLRDAVPRGHGPARPLGERGRRAPLGVGEDARLLGHGDRFGASGPGRVVQAGETVGDEPPFPMLDHARSQADLFAGLAHGLPICQQQDRPRAPGQPGFDGARADDGFEGVTVLRREGEGKMTVHAWSLT